VPTRLRPFPAHRGTLVSGPNGKPGARATLAAQPSDGERALATLILWNKLAAPEHQYAFDPSRKWRFDAAWPVFRLAVEIDGGTFIAGRHSRGAGYERDAEKLNAAVLAGWRVLRFTPHMIEDGRALATLERALLTLTELARP
jgi:very-short-patch-repair endonuclease